MPKAPASKHSWYRKLVPIGLVWLAFIIINSFFNKAPYTKDDIDLLKITLFFLPLFAALYFTIAFLLRKRRRGFLGATLLCGLLIIRIADLTNLLTVILLIASVGFLEWYWSKHTLPKSRLPHHQESHS